MKTENTKTELRAFDRSELLDAERFDLVVDRGNGNPVTMNSVPLTHREGVTMLSKQSDATRPFARLVSRGFPVAAAPRMFDLCHQAADAVIAHRPVKKWIWKSGDANGDVLGTIHDGQEHRARVDTTDSRDYFRCLDLDTGDFGAWFPTVADAVRDYFAPFLAEIFRDWMNNFLTVESFAAHYGLTVAQAHDVIARGKAHHDAVGTLENTAPDKVELKNLRLSFTKLRAPNGHPAFSPEAHVYAPGEAPASAKWGATVPPSAPALTPLTVICGTDTREWDDPVVMFIEATAPEDVRAAVEAEYQKTLGDWAEDGGVILGIMRGHIQLGWSGYNGGNGLPDHTIADAFNNFGVKP